MGPTGYTKPHCGYILYTITKNGKPYEKVIKKFDNIIFPEFLKLFKLFPIFQYSAINLDALNDQLFRELWMDLNFTKALETIKLFPDIKYIKKDIIDGLLANYWDEIDIMKELINKGLPLEYLHEKTKGSIKEWAARLIKLKEIA